MSRGMHQFKGLFSILLFLLFIPHFAFSDSESDSIERSDQKAHQKWNDFDQGLSLHVRRIFKGTSSSQKNNLSPGLRKNYEEYRVLRDEVLFWDQVLDLKKEILKLPANGPVSPPESEERMREAGEIAKAIIPAFGELKQKYHMIRPAGLHNILVNMGLKKEGFCWHWTRDLRGRLLGLDLREFNLLWATAYEGKLREHNTLVIVSKGMGLSDGLLLDGWRNSGTPFWTRISTDHYPWKLGEYKGS